MASTVKKLIILTLLVTIEMTSAQYPVPYPVPYPAGVVQMVPGPPQPVPVPVAMPVPVAVPIPVSETTTTTTTTCRPHEADRGNDEDQPTIRIFVPWPAWPHPGPLLPNISIPFNNHNFTLSFPPQQPYRLIPPGFPVPLPMPAPAPLVMIPIPPMIKLKRNRNERHQKKQHSSSSDSSSSSSDSDTDSSLSSGSDKHTSSKKRKRKNNKKKYGIYRSNRRLMKDDSTAEEIKPILTYHSPNGDIMLQKRLTMEEAALLVAKNTHNYLNKEQIIRKNDMPDNLKLPIDAEDGILSKRKRRAEVNSRTSILQNLRHKELIFKVPDNNTIGNLTVSFNINR